MVSFKNKPSPVKGLTLFNIATLLLSSISMVSEVHAAKPENAGAKSVIVALVVWQQVSDRIEALGTARAVESVNITSNISEKVTQIHFEDGQPVQQGQMLVVLDQAEEQADLKRSEAVRGERKLALQRLQKLAVKKLASNDEIDRTRLELEQAEANISVMKTRIDDRIIKAPFAGTIGLREISLGALVQAGDLIATLDDLRQIKLDFSVPSLYLTELKPGLVIKAKADALNNKEFIGEVKSIASRVDPVTRSIQVRAILDNPHGEIVPGILMQVTLLRNTRNALVIPEAALMPLADKQFVMLRENKDGKDSVSKKLIKIGLRIPGYVEVLSGLSEGDQVVTHGNIKLRPGDILDVMAVDDGSVDVAEIIKQKSQISSKGKQP